MQTLNALKSLVITIFAVSSVSSLADAQGVRPTVIRGFEGMAGTVSCLPQGEYDQSRITSCSEISAQATLGGIPGNISGYIVPSGDRIDKFYSDQSLSSCSIYRQEQGCEAYIRLNGDSFRMGIVRVDPNIGRLTVISYYLEGRRILSIVEDRN